MQQDKQEGTPEPMQPKRRALLVVRNAKSNDKALPFEMASISNEARPII